MKKCTHKELFPNPKSFSNHRRICEGLIVNGYKGDKVGIRGVHGWIKKHYSNPGICKRCGKGNRRIELSNNSGLYKRDISDYEWLCVPCHHIKDGQTQKFIQWRKTHESYWKGKKRGSMNE